jgi:hypothetical protein
MISDEKQYEFITKRIGELSNATEDGLKLFIPMFSAILGGSIWLRFQIKGPAPLEYKYLSNALMSLLTLVCIVIVLDNLRAWWGYRVDLAKLTEGAKHESKPPSIFPSAVIELVLCLAMAIACWMFITYNPFGI